MKFKVFRKTFTAIS